MTPHFVTGTFTSHSSFLPDDTYALLLDNVVKATNDVLIVHDGKMFLGKRKVYPQKSWWFGCGGRMLPGETTIDATSRLLSRELKLTLDKNLLSSRLQTVGHYSLLWEMREQSPQTSRLLSH